MSSNWKIIGPVPQQSNCSPEVEEQLRALSKEQAAETADALHKLVKT